MKDIATAWELVAKADCKKGGLVSDTFHFCLASPKVEDLVKVPTEKVFLIHVPDATDVSPEKLRTNHDYRTSETTRRAAMQPVGGYVDLNMMREGNGRMVFA